MVKKRIRKIRQKVKIIKEIKKNSESIKGITSSETGVSKEDIENVTNRGGGKVSLLGEGGEVREAPIQAEPCSVREESEREEASGSTLYWVGKSLGRAAPDSERSYQPTEDIHTDKITEANVGESFAMPRGGSLLPEAQMTQQTETKM